MVKQALPKRSEAINVYLARLSAQGRKLAKGEKTAWSSSLDVFGPMDEY